MGLGYEAGYSSNLRIDANWDGEVTRIRLDGRAATVTSRGLV